MPLAREMEGTLRSAEVAAGARGSVGAPSMEGWGSHLEGHLVGKLRTRGLRKEI